VGRGILVVVVVNNQVYWLLEPEDEGNTFRRMIGKYTAIKMANIPRDLNLQKYFHECFRR
jgi:hypothetical protein